MAALVCVASAGCDRGSHPGQIGQRAPEFALNDGQTTVDLAKLRGHVIVLNFWATWCAPCVQELPSLELMQRELPQVQVLAVSTDTDAPTYNTFLTRYHITLMSVRDGEDRSNALYGTFRYPETYVIDKAGIVRRKFIGPQDWTSPEIVDYLSKLEAQPAPAA
jgi:cytochrome c biogenesis protein CcmG/thiol:disulfide interchange protein DsbE